MPSSRTISAFLVSIPAFMACSDEPHAPAPDARPAPVLAHEDLAHSPLVLFLGDSLTAGSGLGVTEAYPALIQGKLAREGRLVRVVNAGVSGDTSAGGLARLDWLLKQHPDIVVVALGANDGLRGLPVDEIERNLTAIVQRSLAAGAKVLLAGMLVPPNYGEDYSRAFAAVYPRVAEANHVPLIPFLLEGVGGHAALNQADGLHPNAKGQEQVADTVWKALAELLPAK